MIEVRRLHNCMGEDVYKFSVEGVPAPQLAERLSGLGNLERPLDGTWFVRMDEPGFVLTGNLDSGEFQVRAKATAEVSGLEERVRRTVRADTPRGEVGGG